MKKQERGNKKFMLKGSFITRTQKHRRMSFQVLPRDH